MVLDVELARRNMVDNQIRTWDVVDSRVLEALSATPREAFVPAAWRRNAFMDIAIPLGHGETMMKPVVEGRLLQSLALTGTETVLEIGTGSGFLAACLGHLAKDVTTLEDREDFARAAERILASDGPGNVEVVVAEGVTAWQPPRQFDVLVASGAVAQLPSRWAAWLKAGGRAFAITGTEPAMQAVLLHVDDNGELAARHLFETDLPYLRHAARVPQFKL